MPLFKSISGEVIEAIQYTGSDTPVPGMCNSVLCQARGITVPHVHLIDEVEIGDWLVPGTHGNLFPTSPDVFKRMFRPADSVPTDDGFKDAENLHYQWSAGEVCFDCPCGAKELIMSEGGGTEECACGASTVTFTRCK